MTFELGEPSPSVIWKAGEKKRFRGSEGSRGLLCLKHPRNRDEPGASGTQKGWMVPTPSVFSSPTWSSATKQIIVMTRKDMETVKYLLLNLVYIIMPEKKFTGQTRKMCHKWILLNYMNVEKLIPTYWSADVVNNNMIVSHFEPWPLQTCPWFCQRFLCVRVQYSPQLDLSVFIHRRLKNTALLILISKSFLHMKRWIYEQLGNILNTGIIWAQSYKNSISNVSSGRKSLKCITRKFFTDFYFIQ